MAIFCGDILLHSPYIGLIYGIGTSNQSDPEMAIDISNLEVICKYVSFLGLSNYASNSETTKNRSAIRCPTSSL